MSFGSEGEAKVEEGVLGCNSSEQFQVADKMDIKEEGIREGVDSQGLVLLGFGSRLSGSWFGRRSGNGSSLRSVQH